MGLTGKLALVTGGGSGIGRAVCQVLARENARVIVADINMAASMDTIKSLKQNQHLPLEGDVSKSSSVKSCFQQILEEYSASPDIVINSAGITKDGWLLRMKEKDFDQVIDINLKGTFLVSQAAASAMKEAGIKGSIVNIGSIVGKTGNMGQANYSASKAGVIGFTKTAAKELGQFGIRVNVILPGFIKTPMTDVVPEKMKLMARSQIPLKLKPNTQPETLKARVFEKIIGRPLGDLGDPEDIAEVAAFLASDKSSYMTGASLDVNAGLL